MVVNEEKITIIEHDDKYNEEIVSFIRNIAMNEFGYNWRDYFEHMSFDEFENDGSKFWIVLNQKGKIIGTMGVVEVSKNDEAKLKSLYVDKTYRHHGIAKTLYENMISFVTEKGYNSIILQTHSKFNIAIKFYEKNGFKLYYTDKGGDRLWYRKMIK